VLTCFQTMKDQKLSKIDDISTETVQEKAVNTEFIEINQVEVDVYSSPIHVETHEHETKSPNKTDDSVNYLLLLNYL
jgi:hypothetical protein